MKAHIKPKEEEISTESYSPNGDEKKVYDEFIARKKIY